MGSMGSALVQSGVGQAVGSVIDSTGVGALTGTGFNGASQALGGLGGVSGSGGVVNGIKNAAALAGAGMGAEAAGAAEAGAAGTGAEAAGAISDMSQSVTPQVSGADAVDMAGMENMFQNSSMPESFQLSNDINPTMGDHAAKAFGDAGEWAAERGGDFMDGLFTDKSTFATDEKGTWDPQKSIPRAAGRAIKNKTIDALSGNKKRIQDAREILAEMMKKSQEEIAEKIGFDYKQGFLYGKIGKLS